MASRLTNNALKKILEGGETPNKPILQVLSTRKIPAQSATSVDRWRLQISDGDSYQPCMVATQLNNKIANGEVEQYAIICLDKYVCNIIQGRKIIIIIQMSLVEAGCLVGGIIGSPASLDMKKVDSGAPPTSTSRPPHQPTTMGGAGAPPAMNRTSYNPSATSSEPPKPSFSGGSSYNSVPTQGGWGAKPYNGSAATNKPMTSAISPNRDPHPISSLTPYQNKWTIRVRATAKPQVRNYSNSRGSGKLMSVEFVDKSGEIRATAFNEAADKFGPIIEANKVYYISKARVKPANKQYSSVKNDYELFLQEDTIVEEDTDGAASSDLPKLQFNFTPIDQLSSLPKDTLVDVIGVCKSANDVTSVTVRTTNRQVSKRDIELVDMTGTVVSMTLWSTDAEEFDGSSNPVLAVKGARLSDFGGCSMSVLNSSTVQINPDIPEAFRLRGWFDNDGKTAETISISGQRTSGGMQTPWLSTAQVRELNLGHGDKPDYFSIKGFVSFFKKDNCLYQACPKPDCNKKVTESNMGYHCEKCNQTSPDFKWRLMLQTCIADWSGCLWFTCFQDQAETLLKRKADEIGTLKDKPDQTAEYDQIFSDATFGEFTFKLRAKMEVYNDEQRLKVMCVEAAPVDHAQNAKRLIQEIRELVSRT